MYTLAQYSVHSKAFVNKLLLSHVIMFTTVISLVVFRHSRLPPGKKGTCRLPWPPATRRPRRSMTSSQKSTRCPCTPPPAPHPPPPPSPPACSRRTTSCMRVRERLQRCATRPSPCPTPRPTTRTSTGQRGVRRCTLVPRTRTTLVGRVPCYCGGAWCRPWWWWLWPELP